MSGHVGCNCTQEEISRQMQILRTGPSCLKQMHQAINWNKNRGDIYRLFYRIRLFQFHYMKDGATPISRQLYPVPDLFFRTQSPSQAILVLRVITTAHVREH